MQDQPQGNATEAPLAQGQIDSHLAILEKALEKLSMAQEQVVSRLQCASRQELQGIGDNQNKEIEPNLCAYATRINDCKKQVDRITANLVDALARLEL